MIRGGRILLAFAIAVAIAAPAEVLAGPPACKPKRARPPIVLKNMGACAFDPQSYAFAGAPPEQAACLMRGMDKTRNLAAAAAVLPPDFAARLGARTDLPAPQVLAGFLLAEGFDWDVASSVWYALSRARDNDPDAPTARYFVLHDTSGPNYGRRPFPADIDTRAKVNDLRNFKCRDNWEKAHAVINRRGEMLLSHDFGTPWRETKFERAKNFQGALKGLFLHVELVQPRRRAPGWRSGDTQTPTPPFTAAQYDSLALLYAMASVRAGAWMIPAFHAAIDSGIPGGHDDPLGFSIDAFAQSVSALLERVRRRTDLASGTESSP